MDITFSIYLSDKFKKWFYGYFSSKLSEASFKLYVQYASAFANFIEKDFLLYTKEDANKYSQFLLELVQQEQMKPKTAYNELAILSSIASAMADTLGITDFFSEQERPFVEYTPISQRQIPDTGELDRILSAAKEYDDTLVMYTALYLIGTYALSRSEVLSLNPDTVFLQDSKIIIQRKEMKILGVTLPRLIALDNTAGAILEPLFKQMVNRVALNSREPIFLFCDRNGSAIKPHSFSYAFRCILELAGLSNTYTLRDLRAGSLARIARIGGSDALFETAGLRSVWGERYVAASGLLSSAQVLDKSHSVNAYDNFVLIQKNELSSALESAYHILNRSSAATLSLAVSDNAIESTIVCDETGDTFQLTSDGNYVRITNVSD